jgi:hypothetical protein
VAVLLLLLLLFCGRRLSSEGESWRREATFMAERKTQENTVVAMFKGKNQNQI